MNGTNRVHAEVEAAKEADDADWRNGVEVVVKSDEKFKYYTSVHGTCMPRMYQCISRSDL